MKEGPSLPWTNQPTHRLDTRSIWGDKKLVGFLGLIFFPQITKDGATYSLPRQGEVGNKHVVPVFCLFVIFQSPLHEAWGLDPSSWICVRLFDAKRKKHVPKKYVLPKCWW